MEATGAYIKLPITNDGALVLACQLHLQHLRRRPRMQTQRASESHGSRVGKPGTVRRHVQRWGESAATAVRGQQVFPNLTPSKMARGSQPAKRTLTVENIGIPRGSGQ